jgi:predicted nucleic acid-binding protein
MRVLVDTNVLLGVAVPAHSLSATAVQALRKLRTAGHDLFIVPQNIYECWTAATRTADHNGLGLSTAETEKAINELNVLVRILKDERAIYEEWLELVSKYQITGANSYDTRLAAAMHRHNMSHILTFNASDFRRFPHVQILDPKAVAEVGEGS